MCIPLRSCYCHFYLPKRETDPLPWWVLTRELKREVLPQPLTLLRLHICDQEPRDSVATTSVAIGGLLITPTGNFPALPRVFKREKAWFEQQPGAVKSMNEMYMNEDGKWWLRIKKHNRRFWYSRTEWKACQVFFTVNLFPKKNKTSIYDFSVYWRSLCTDGNISKDICDRLRFQWSSCFYRFWIGRTRVAMRGKKF